MATRASMVRFLMAHGYGAWIKQADLADIRAWYRRSKGEPAGGPAWLKKLNPGKRGGAVLSAAQRALAKHKKRIAAERAAYAAAQKQQGTTGAVRLNPGPLQKLLREAGARRVRVMRSKSGKPTGVKFL